MQAPHAVPKFIIDDEVAWENLGGGVRRKILGHDDELMLVLVDFEEGAVGTPHSHPHRQVSYVVAGALELVIDGDRRVLRQGDSFFVTPDLRHSAVALEPSTLIDVFTPARQEFLAAEPS